MKAKVKIYDGVKYDNCSRKIADLEYTNVEGYSVISGEDGKKIGSNMDIEDEFNEYLVITFSNTQKAIFCNSHVVLFV